MKQRIITGAVLTVILACVLTFSGTAVLPLFCAVLSAIGAFEVLRVFRHQTCMGLLIPALLYAGALPALAHMTDRDAFLLLPDSVRMTPSMYLTVFLTATVLYLFTVFVFGILTGGIHGFTKSLAGAAMIVYVTLGFVSLVLLRRMSGLPLAVLVFVGSWVSDTFAYFTGRLLGRHKLAPLVSPKKTVEGSLGGMVFSALAAILLGVCLTAADVIVQPDYLLLAVAGVLLSVASQAGDLTTSLLKREYDVKDYGTLFPGHGGVLDRFDSVIAVAVILLLFAALTGTEFSILGNPVIF